MLHGGSTAVSTRSKAAEPTRGIQPPAGMGRCGVVAATMVLKRNNSNARNTSHNPARCVRLDSAKIAVVA